MTASRNAQRRKSDRRSAESADGPVFASCSSHLLLKDLVWRLVLQTRPALMCALGGMSANRGQTLADASQCAVNRDGYGWGDAGRPKSLWCQDAHLGLRSMLGEDYVQRGRTPQRRRRQRRLQELVRQPPRALRISVISLRLNEAMPLAIRLSRMRPAGFTASTSSGSASGA